MTTATKDRCEKLKGAGERYFSFVNELEDLIEANPAAFEGWDIFPNTLESIFFEPEVGAVVNPDALKLALGGEWGLYGNGSGGRLISRRGSRMTLWIRLFPRGAR